MGGFFYLKPCFMLNTSWFKVQAIKSNKIFTFCPLTVTLPPMTICLACQILGAKQLLNTIKSNRLSKHAYVSTAAGGCLAELSSPMEKLLAGKRVLNMFKNCPSLSCDP